MLKNLRKRKNEVNKTNKDRLNNLFKKINYKTNGITLIALVITIIVLLILARSKYCDFNRRKWNTNTSK